MTRQIYKQLLLTLLLLYSFKSICTPNPIFSVDESLFDKNDKVTLGLPYIDDMAHSTVFSAQDSVAQYNHGAVAFAFKNRLYVQWQSSSQDEDSPDTQVLYSHTSNTTKWAPATILASHRANSFVTSGGWWSDGNTLVAFINVWPNNMKPKSGHVEYSTSQDGEIWTEFLPLVDHKGNHIKGINEQDLKALPNGRILTAMHRAPGLIATPFFTDDPLGISGWRQGTLENLPFNGNISRELEPSWFINAQGHIVMVFRDQSSSFKMLAAVSKDNGETWSPVERTNMPDSRAKQSAGNINNGTAYLINNPTGNKTRHPLVLTLSQDGNRFTSAFLIRYSSNLPPMLYKGKYKRAGYSYPKSIVWNNKIIVSYAINKEDIAITQIDISQFKHLFN